MEITTALAALKATFDLAKVGLEARDDAKVKAAISDMAARLADANLAGLEMSLQLRTLEGEVRDLTEKLREAEDRERRRKSYALHEIKSGLFVRAFRPVPGDSTPAHYQCQVCFDEGRDSVLQTSPNGAWLWCLVDSKHHLKIGSEPIAVARRPSRYGDDGGWMGS